MAFPAFLSALFNERIEINTLLGKILIIHPFSKIAAEAFGLAASALAVVQLSAKIVKICAQYTKDVANARQDIQRLQREVGILGLVADSVRELTDDTSQHKLTTIEKVQSFLDEARTRLSELHTKLDPGQRKEDMWRVGLRAIKWPFSSKDAEKALADLARLTQAISLAISVDQTTLLISSEQRTALAKLPFAEGAAYDSHADEHNPQCLRNTRTDILSEIVQWVGDPSQRAVYWLNGMAGTGKSTISRTIAHKFSSKYDIGARLCATFFFKRGEGDRGKMSKFFTTITSQLIQQLPEIAGYVQYAIEADPALISKAMRIQFKTLIIDPVAKISSIDHRRRILLFVIDALDECEREKDVQLLIELLSGIPRDMAVQPRFFLTSRPELPIRLGFNSINGKYRDFILHEVAGPVIEHDLQVYFRHELERTRLTFNYGLPEERRIPPNWPNTTDVGSLVQMTTPLFIFAATICRFVADRKGGNPAKKLRRVLEFRSTQGSKLVATYMPVLEQLTMDIALEEQSEILLQFAKIVGSIVVLADPLGCEPLSGLLNVEPNEILELLDFLHSVLQVPSLPEQPIRLLHLSFRDFLVDPARQGNPFWINEREVHQELAAQCLRVLNSSLKKDICGVKAPGTLTSSISASIIRTSIPLELQYACRFWAYHLRESPSPDLHTADIWKFLRLHFLQWLEVLSWIGRLPESFGIVTTLQSISHIERDYEMVEFLEDSVRFLHSKNSSIQIAPLQAYYSSLAFAPSQSIVRRIYEDNMADYIALGPKMSSSWDDRLQTFEVYSGNIRLITSFSYGKLLGVAFKDGTVILLEAHTGKHRLKLKGSEDSLVAPAFSPDGKLLALVMDSTKVTLWYTETCEYQKTFDGHEDAVYRLNFSPDSKLLASLSNKGVVILWAVDTGKPQQTLKRSLYLPSGVYLSALPYSLAISPDNELLAMITENHTLILWETETGKCQEILSGLSGNIESIEFSFDSKLLALAQSDRKVILWDTKNAEVQQLFEAQSGIFSTVAFSLDNDLLASGINDGTVILWHIKTGQQRSLKGHDSAVRSIAFSPDGKFLASVSGTGTVFLWATETCKRLRTFECGAGQGNHISFSSDNKRLAATSGYGSISIWATNTMECGQTLEKHSKSVNVMKFSPDGKSLASASADGSVILWRADTGEHRQTLEGHSDWVDVIAFSPDSKLLISASVDQTVVLWTVDTGERRQTLKGLTDRINQVVFSPNSKMLATASYDQTVALWTTDTGACLQTLKGHSARMTSIVFSPDCKMLASASWDRTVTLWSTDTGERLKVLGEYSFIPREISFPCDGKLVALNSNGTLTLWRADLDKGWDKSWQRLLDIDHSDSSVESNQNAHSFAVVESSPIPALMSGSCGTDAIGPGVSQDQRWICLNGEPVLWLPPEYRVYRWTVSGHTIAIGYESGRILFVRLKSLFVSP